MARHSHDGSLAVAHEDVVADPHFQTLAAQWMRDEKSVATPFFSTVARSASATPPLMHSPINAAMRALSSASRLPMGGVAEADLATRGKEGCGDRIFVTHPLSGERLEVWISNYVLMGYGEEPSWECRAMTNATPRLRRSTQFR